MTEETDNTNGNESLFTVLTDRTFFSVVSKHELFVVDFWAPWCGPCKGAFPIIEESAIKYSTRARFGKLNIDENPAIADMFGVENIPSIFIFRDGRPLDSLVGSVTKSSIESFLAGYLESPIL